MSDEEWDSIDDSSSETESLTTGSDENSKCPYCKIYKIAAKTGLCAFPKKVLHRWTPENPMRGYYLRRQRISYHRIKEGSRSIKGCRFCDLLVDAFTSWGKEQCGPLFDAFIAWEKEQGMNGSVSNFTWKLRLEDGQFIQNGQFIIELYANLGRGFFVSVSVFRATARSSWNICRSENLLCKMGSTSSPEAVDTARRWIENCKDNHGHCKRESHAQRFPKRILELDSKQVKLCENVRPAVAYACLSHCWGPNGPAMQLRPDTIADLKAGVPLETLPKTFHDAAWFCLRLGIHYIWIDALCIIQGDEADWKEAAATMADVYEDALITIAASWSNSSEAGCFAPAITNTYAIALSERGLYCQDQPENVPLALECESRQWPLFQRAWVYQERRISTRVLHFGEQQLFWECNSRMCSASDLRGGKPGIYGLKSTKAGEKPESGWRAAMEHYSGLRLTYEKDRLPAISALVKRMQRHRPGDVYISGMWKKTLCLDLCWFASPAEPQARPYRPGIVMPSWSWISVSGGVSFPGKLKPSPTFKVTNVVYSITGPAHIGQVTHASIHVEARFLFVKPDLTASPNFGALKHPDGTWEDAGPTMMGDSSGWDFDYTTADPPIHTSETFVALLVAISHKHVYVGIVLRELTNKQFERVGYVRYLGPELDHKSAKRFDQIMASLPIGQFTIV